MGLSQRVQCGYLWADEGELARYRKGKISKLNFYCSREFCPGVPKRVNVVKALKKETAQKGEA